MIVEPDCVSSFWLTAEGSVATGWPTLQKSAHRFGNPSVRSAPWMGECWRFGVRDYFLAEDFDPVASDSAWAVPIETLAIWTSPVEVSISWTVTSWPGSK